MQSGHDAAKAKQPVPKWVPVVLVGLSIQYLCLPLSASLLAGSLYGRFERPHCFVEASANGAGFDQGATAETENRAFTNLTPEPHHYRVCRCSH